LNDRNQNDGAHTGNELSSGLADGNCQSNTVAAAEHYDEETAAYSYESPSDRSVIACIATGDTKVCDSRDITEQGSTTVVEKNESKSYQGGDGSEEGDPNDASS
jgi:hypothetical protein